MRGCRQPFLRRSGKRRAAAPELVHERVRAERARRGSAGRPGGRGAVTPVVHYGHGYGVAVAQGKVEGGLATNWNSDGFGWTGFGAPGDSGSPVLTASGQAAGDFTHLIVDTQTYPGSTLAGTRITKALSRFGVSLVNADGSLTGAAGTTC